MSSREREKLSESGEVARLLPQPQKEYGKITPDGAWWINTPRHGWLKVDDVLDRLDRSRRTENIAIAALSLASGALAGIIFPLIVRLL